MGFPLARHLAAMDNAAAYAAGQPFFTPALDLREVRRPGAVRIGITPLGDLGVLRVTKTRADGTEVTADLNDGEPLAALSHRIFDVYVGPDDVAINFVYSVDGIVEAQVSQFQGGW